MRGFFPEFEPHRGPRLRGNFYKCGDATVRPHYLAWNPVTSETPAFHRPWEFGEIVLGDKAPPGARRTLHGTAEAVPSRRFRIPRRFKHAARPPTRNRRGRPVNPAL